MTISSTTNRVSYAGNGVTTAFSFPYYFLADGDLTVILVVDATHVETTKTLTTHYTVSGAANPAGGTVTMLTAPAAGETLVILRDPAVTQSVDLVENDPLPVNTAVEQPLDRLTMIAQRLKDLVTRAFRLSDGDTSGASLTITPEASKFLAWNSTGTALINATPSSTTIAVTTFIATLLDDTTAAAARTTLGLGTASTQNTGTSGANVPLLNGNNTHSGTNAFAGVVTLSAVPINEAKGTDLASAATVNIGAALGNLIDITGTAAITAFDTVQAGVSRVVRFTGALTLTHNATSLILWGSNITTANGDRAVFRSLGSGNWICIQYIYAASLFPAAQGCSKALISSSTASASNYFQFDNLFSSTYDAYELIVIGARPTTDGSVFKLQVGTGAGPTYDTTGNYTDTFHVSNDGVASEGGTAGRAYISLSGEIGFGNASTKPTDSNIRIYHPTSAAFHKMVKFNTTGIGTGAGFYEAMGSGKYNSATAITGVRLFYGTAGTNTIAEGSAYLYGIKKA